MWIWTLLKYAVFPIFFLLWLHALWVAYIPKECEPAGQPCMTPLFGVEQKVDVYVYTTLSQRLNWRTEFDRLTPLWNATGIDFHVDANATVDVDLPPSVRNNGTLYAHVFMVRTGLDPNPAKHKRRRDKREPQRQAWSENVEYHDLLHAQTTLTRIMPPIARKRSNLLSEAINGSGTAAAGVLVVPLPLGHSIVIYPSGAICWCTAVFAVSGLLPPSLICAMLRHAALSMGVPYLIFKHLENARLAKSAEDLEAARLLGSSPRPPVTHWKPSIAIRVVTDSGLYPANEPPPVLYEEFESTTKSTPKRYAVWGGDMFDAAQGAKLEYKPPFYVDDAMTMVSDYLELSTNTSMPPPKLVIELLPVSRIYFQFSKLLEEGTKVYRQFGLTERDLEEIKYLFGRSNIRRMAVLQAIGFVQMVLSGLAFKNDITFFSGRQDYAGLSAGSLKTQFMITLIIFLFLYDDEYTSKIVLCQIAVEVALDLWKVTRRLHLGIAWKYLLPWARWARDSDWSALEKKTEEIDERGMSYLKTAVMPIVLVSAMYSLYHYSYKSWWSWLISSLANGCYMFGFINMCPQIFINYKFKSVSHLPWRVFWYKAFNTFIDDAVAFGGIINMPAKHRWMTLRDDLVFLVILYQRYLYPVDPTRPDEFGMVYNEVATSLKTERDEQMRSEANNDNDDNKCDHGVVSCTRHDNTNDDDDDDGDSRNVVSGDDNNSNCRNRNDGSHRSSSSSGEEGNAHDSSKHGDGSNGVVPENVSTMEERERETLDSTHDASHRLVEAKKEI